MERTQQTEFWKFAKSSDAEFYGTYLYPLPLREQAEFFCENPDFFGEETDGEELFADRKETLYRRIRNEIRETAAH